MSRKWFMALAALLSISGVASAQQAPDMTVLNLRYQLGQALQAEAEAEARQAQDAATIKAMQARLDAATKVPVPAAPQPVPHAPLPRMSPKPGAHTGS